MDEEIWNISHKDKLTTWTVNLKLGKSGIGRVVWYNDVSEYLKDETVMWKLVGWIYELQNSIQAYNVSFGAVKDAQKNGVVHSPWWSMIFQDTQL